MSPRPPPLIYPRTTLPPSSSTMADSLRPMPPTAFPPPQQLPPPIFGNNPGTSQRFSGPILAPLAIPSSGSVGSTLPRPPGQQKQSTHIPSQHPPPQHAPSPLQTPHKLDRRVSTTPYGGIMPQPPYNSPATSVYPSPAPFNNPERGFEERKFSFDSDLDRRRYADCWYAHPSGDLETNPAARSSLSTMIPSPTYTTKRSVGDDFMVEQQHQQQQQNYTSRFTPTSVDDAVSARREQRSQARFVCTLRKETVPNVLLTCIVLDAIQSKCGNNQQQLGHAALVNETDELLTHLQLSSS